MQVSHIDAALEFPQSFTPISPSRVRPLARTIPSTGNNVASVEKKRRRKEIDNALSIFYFPAEVCVGSLAYASRDEASALSCITRVGDQTRVRGDFFPGGMTFTIDCRSIVLHLVIHLIYERLISGKANPADPAIHIEPIVAHERANLSDLWVTRTLRPGDAL